MTNKDKYIKDLDSLILRGVELQRGLYNELRDEYKDSFDKLSADEKEKFWRQALRTTTTLGIMSRFLLLSN